MRDCYPYPVSVRYSSVMTRRTPFVTVGLHPDARDALRQGAIDVTAAAGRVVSMSDFARAAVAVALEHRDELVAELKGGAS